MTDELHPIEERLRLAGRLTGPPERFAELARAAVLGEPDDEPVTVAPVRAQRPAPGRSHLRLLRASLAAVVIVASTAAALFIGVGGNRMHVEETVALAGKSGASGSVDIGGSHGPVRDVVLKVDGLGPAPQGAYYEMWISAGDRSMPLAAFNTSNGGDVEVHTSMPANMGWDACWVTVEDAAGGSATVLRQTT
jgi:hypothetical protein